MTETPSPAASAIAAELRARTAEPRQAPEIRALIDRFVADGTLLPRTEEFIREHAGSFVVVEDEHRRVVGCAHLDEYAPSLGELRSLAVSPEAQGRGVGRALVAAIDALARRRDITTLFAVSNDEAFFRRHGFEPRHIPELDRERSAVSRYKGVFAKAVD